MPKTIRNLYFKYLTYDKLLEAHSKSRKGKGYRKEIILFNLKQEEYIMWLLEKLQNKTYKHGGYSTFYVTEPKLRKIEKFSIGTEYKQSMYQMLSEIMILNKIKNKSNQEAMKILDILNRIDSKLNTQRIYLRIMKKNRWIDEKKFKIAMELIYEIGKILGGLIKYYAKNN